MGRGGGRGGGEGEGEGGRGEGGLHMLSCFIDLLSSRLYFLRKTNTVCEHKLYCLQPHHIQCSGDHGNRPR